MCDFDRVPAVFRPAIEEARRLIEAKTTIEFVWPRILCGLSPSFVGLHHYDLEGDSYDNVAHCAYGYLLVDRPMCDRKTTLVLPERVLSPIGVDREPPYNAVAIVAHELGHVIHEALSFQVLVPTTTSYSETAHTEAFAEAFEILVTDPSGRWIDRFRDPAFDQLREAVGFLA